MTKQPQAATNTDSRVSNNAKRAVSAHKRLDAILNKASDADFTGGVSIWIGSHEGRIGTLKVVTTEHHKS